MSAPTLAVWRFALGQQVRWAGDNEVYVIVQRRWVERELLPPYAEYALAGGAQWEVEADLEAVPCTRDRPGPHGG